MDIVIVIVINVVVASAVIVGTQFILKRQTKKFDDVLTDHLDEIFSDFKDNRPNLEVERVDSEKFIEELKGHIFKRCSKRKYYK